MEKNHPHRVIEPVELVAFVVMCFEVELKPVYEKVVKRVLQDHGFVCYRGDELNETGILIEQVVSAINNATVVLGDLTFRNPNVYYELGIAHHIGKPTILITQHTSDIPFNLRHHRVIPYQTDGCGLIDLSDNLAAALKHLGFQGNLHRSEGQLFHDMKVNSVDFLRGALNSNDVFKKHYAIKHLGDLLDKESFEAIRLIAASPNENPEVRREAFTSLFKINSVDALPYLIQQGLRNQRELLVRERVVHLLAEYPPTPLITTQLLQQIGDSSWGVRRAVCEAFAKLRLKEAVPRLNERLNDIEYQVRSAAQDALESLMQKPSDVDAGKPPTERETLKAT